MAIPVINIGSKLDGKGFKQAETALSKLSGSAKKVAGSLGLAFGTAAVVAFGKKSVKAFADSESEATRLRIAVSNLGLAFAAPQIDQYIDKIELATGVNRDQLQPAFLTLLQTTGSLTKSQELLNLSLDVAAATGADASSVAEKLSQAYLGNTKSLKTLNLGLTTAELNSADFETIQKRITKLFAGQGQAAADSYTGQINKLAIASEQASEIIGGGLVDSLLILSGNTDVNALADDMLTAAYNTAEFTKSVVGLAKAINAPIKGISDIVTRFIKATDPFVDLIIEGDPSGFFKKKPQSGANAPVAGINGKTFYADAEKNAKALAKAEAEAKKRAAELLKIKNKQLESEKKALAAKKLAAAIDKANIVLGKGNEVFDMDKIQIAAALTNQAQQLGKVTSSAQVLQIANDTARLNVKRSILDLEDAIALKDEAAIIKATAKLNEDLKILNALTGQKTQMTAIESILAGLKPKELIDQENLNEALRKIKQMMDDLAKIKFPTAPSSGGGGGGGGGGGAFIQTPNGIYPTTPPRTIEAINKAVEELGGVVSVIGENGKEFIKLVDGAAPVFQGLEDSMAKNMFISQGILTQPFNAGSFREAEGGSMLPAARGIIQGVNQREFYSSFMPQITVNTGIGDPNAIAEAISQVVQDAVDRGTLRGGIY